MKQKDLPPFPKGVVLEVDQTFVEAVVDFCKKQENFNYNMLDILQQCKTYIVKLKKRLSELEKTQEEGINIPITYISPKGGNGSLH